MSRHPNGFDTILVLDVSGSMNEGNALGHLKHACSAFLDGVERTLSQYGLPENVGIVTFGDQARIVCPLTNNINYLRRCVNGLVANGGTPMAQGLTLALQEIAEHGGAVRVGQISLHPRIILMTDGKPTCAGKSDAEAKEEVLLISVAFGPHGYRQVGLPYPVPIACVGCGSQVDHDMLQTMATVSGGMYQQVANGAELSTFFTRQVLLVVFMAQHAQNMRELQSLQLLMAFLREAEGGEVSEAEALVLLAFIMAMVEQSGEQPVAPPQPRSTPRISGRTQPRVRAPTESDALLRQQRKKYKKTYETVKLCFITGFLCYIPWLYGALHLCSKNSTRDCKKLAMVCLFLAVIVPSAILIYVLD